MLYVYVTNAIFIEAVLSSVFTFYMHQNYTKKISYFSDDNEQDEISEVNEGIL